MKKTWLVLMAWFMAYGLLQAQEVVVLDAVTRDVLPFATVSTARDSYTANERGRVTVPAMNGADTLLFSMLGYETYRVSYNNLKIKKFQVYLQPGSIRLDEVVVSASRWAQSRGDISQKVSVIRPGEIAFQNPQTSADLIGQSGEVFIQKSQQGGGSPMIRGFATNRVLIAVDGVRMNNAIFRSGNLQNIISIDPFSVQSAEILFGPGSVMYGSDAIGGVMVFNTLEPTLSEGGTKAHGHAVSRFSSAGNELTTHIDVQLAASKWASATSFTYNHFGDLRMGSKGPDSYLKPYYVERSDSLDRVVTNPDPLVQTPSGYNQQNLLQKLIYQPNDQLRMEYGFYYSTTSDYARYDRLLRLRGGLPRSAEWYYGPQEWTMHRMMMSHESDNKIYDRMRITAAFQRFGESRHDRDLNKAIRYNRYEKVDAFSLNADFTREFGLKSKLFYGLELITNKVASTGTDENIKTGLVVPGPARYPASDWASYAAFAGYQYKPTVKTTFHAGLRYNYHQLQADFDTSLFALPYKTAEMKHGALTGNLGFTQKITASFLAMVNLSTGFRSPNVDDMGKLFDSEPGAVMVPNADLKPEYAYNAELGLSKVWGKVFKADLSAYYTLLADALVRRPFLLNGQDSIVYAGELSQVLAIQNAASAKVYGLQAALELKLPEGFSMLGNFTWQKGEEELDNGSTSPLRHAAPFFGMVRLRYAQQNVMLELNTHFSDEVSFDEMPEEEKDKGYMYAIDAEGNPYSPSWMTLNFKTSVKVSETFMVSGGVENLLDKRYRPYSSGLVAPGRNLIFSLHFNF